MHFELFSPHIIFQVDGEGGREKVIRDFRTVRVIVELVTGNMLKN